MPELVLDFTTVSREIRSIVARRRELLIFLGSMFAAMSLFLQKVLDGELPRAFRSVEHHAFAAHALLVLVPCVILVLRVAKLHAGMTINGVFYAHIERTLGRPADPARAARLNWLGVSASLVWLMNLLAAGETVVLALALHQTRFVSVVAGCGVFIVCGLLFARFHATASRFAQSAIQHARVESVTHEDLEEHWAESRSDVNHDMIALNGFAGLMLFSTLENIVGFGKIGIDTADLAASDIETYGPRIYAGLFLAICTAVATMYVRLSLAAAKFSLQLDPTDTPYRPLKLTDSFLGYLLIVFFLGVSVHLSIAPWFTEMSRAPWMVDAVAMSFAGLLYPAALKRAGSRQGRT